MVVMILLSLSLKIDIDKYGLPKVIRKVFHATHTCLNIMYPTCYTYMFKHHVSNIKHMLKEKTSVNVAIRTHTILNVIARL